MTTLPPGAQIQPIDSLTPFLNGRWWIKARVTEKSDIRTWNKPTSQGKLFSFTLVDQTAAIRATMFQDAVDMFFPMLQTGQIFYFSGGQIKAANKKFSNVNNDYELSFDKAAQIIPARTGDSDAFSIPTLRYNFVPIQILKQREAGSMVDVLAAVLHIGDVSTIVQKATNRELTKRSVKIADTTAAIELTLWGDAALSFSLPVGSIVAFRQVRTGSYDGVTLGTTMQTVMDVNPNVPDTKKLSDWFISTGGSDVASLSSQGIRGDGSASTSENFHGRRFFDDIQLLGLGRGMNADFIDVRCTPVYLKSDSQWYDACPTCNKKVVAVGAAGNQSKCEKCDRMVVPQQRYLLSLQASDNVSQIWLTLFNEAGQEFFGMPATELKKRCEADPQFITKIAQARLFRPVLMRIRVKEERGGAGGADGEDRMRCSVTRITEILGIPGVDEQQSQSAVKPRVGSIAEECNHLLECISAYGA
mmetsp:Transcript_83369/g.97458  ORF Transcript_83369/g.97458 Transcript_83369/m.97458 type:complete len:474 (+) Transcript_83369:29-1450(+)